MHEQDHAVADVQEDGGAVQERGGAGPGVWEKERHAVRGSRCGNFGGHYRLLPFFFSEPIYFPPSTCNIRAAVMDDQTSMMNQTALVRLLRERCKVQRSARFSLATRPNNRNRALADILDAFPFTKAAVRVPPHHMQRLQELLAELHFDICQIFRSTQTRFTRRWT